MEYLDLKLLEYEKENITSFHMPGHKGRLDKKDITEITGFDNLLNPEGIILDLERKAAEIYGAAYAFILVNGSTAGNLVSYLSLIKRGEKVLIERSAHKSVYHGAALSGADIRFLNENENKNISFYDDIDAIVLTTPSYDGRFKDLSFIKKLKEKKDIRVIIDAAHGAHLPFLTGEVGEEGRCHFKDILEIADAVTLSLHKTLPSMTQTALLLIPENSCLNKEGGVSFVRKNLSAIETSSPSYVLMSSVSKCIRFLDDEKNKRSSFFNEYEKNLLYFYEKIGDLKEENWPSSFFFPSIKKGFDITKITLRSGILSGDEMLSYFRDECGIEAEMAGYDNLLFLSSVFDEREDLLKLYNGIKSIKKRYGKNNLSRRAPAKSISYLPKKRMEFKEAFFKEGRIVSLKSAAKKHLISSDMVLIYPPGSPVVIPGEEIDWSVKNIIENAVLANLNVNGIRVLEGGEIMINIIK